MFKKKPPINQIEILTNDLDENDVTSLIIKWQEVNVIKKQIVDLEELLKLKIKTFLKERNWNRYKDKKTKIGISISVQQRTSINKELLKEMLNEAQMTRVLKTSTFEKLSIVTPETRERLKSYVRTNKKFS